MNEIREEQPNSEQEPMSEMEQPQAEMPEDFVEPKGKSKGWGEPVETEIEVEGKKEKVRYREKVIELPKHRQQETGIKRIRRREILEMPDNIKPRGDANWWARGYDFSHTENGHTKNWEFLRYLTDGRFPSLQVWNHTLMGDLKGNEKLFYELAETHGKELVYFQDVAPLDVGNDESRKVYKRWTYLENHGGVLEKIDIPTTDEERKKAISYYNMSVGVESWLDPLQTPVYVFGNRNKAFVNYIESILQNSEIKAALAASWPRGWKEHFEESDLTALNQEQIDYWTNFGYFGKNEQKQGEIFSLDGHSEYFDCLRYLIEGRKIKHLMGHPYIPIVRHPDIPKFRWCHAELALVPTKRSLNVLFFETGDEDKPASAVSSGETEKEK